ncbi:ribosomal protein L7/L12 [Clostridium merdae]|uniref:ribosomal protein L7/L12 n=1 Tax=Clostridium merdae TaxID=1958780 RepID=UPI000A2673DA|nr:ribosomal protein L7/L12 [Clostridium merdae]
MICSYCGAEIKGGKFCSECGAPIVEAAAQLEPARIDFSVRLGPDKYYEKDEKVISAALAHHVFSDSGMVILYVGNLYSVFDSYFMFVNKNEIVFCKINEKKPDTDIITRVSYTDSRLDDFYDTKWSKLKLKEEFIGFKPQKISAYPNNWIVAFNEVQRLRGKAFSAPPDKKAVSMKHQPPVSFDGLNISEIASMFGKDKIKAIKYVRYKTGCELKEAKAFIDHGYATMNHSPAQVPETTVEASKSLSKKDRIKENKANGVACCPKCGSTSLSANKKGFGVGKAAVGVFTVGVLGAAAGGIGSGKVVVTCLNCGHRWKV